MSADEVHCLMEGCAAKRLTHKPGHHYTPALTVACGPTREGARGQGKLDRNLIRHATQGAYPVPQLRVLLYGREQSPPPWGKRDGCQRTPVMVMPRSSGSAAVYWVGELAGRQYEIFETDARIARITRRGSERGVFFSKGEKDEKKRRARAFARLSFGFSFLLSTRGNEMPTRVAVMLLLSSL